MKMNTSFIKDKLMNIAMDAHRYLEWMRKFASEGLFELPEWITSAKIGTWADLLGQIPLASRIIIFYREAVAAGELPPRPKERNIFQKLGDALGYGPETRQTIRRGVYKAVFQPAWEKAGLELVGIDKSLDSALDGGLGQWVELATSVIPAISAKFASEKATETQAEAWGVFQKIIGGFEDYLGRAKAALATSGITWSLATPEEADAFANRFTSLAEGFHESKYKLALEKAVEAIKEKTVELEERIKERGLEVKASQVASKVSDRFDKLFDRPEVSQVMATHSHWSQAEVKQALASAAANMDLTPKQVTMVNEVGKYIEKPEEASGWTALLVPGAIMALSIL